MQLPLAATVAQSARQKTRYMMKDVFHVSEYICIYTHTRVQITIKIIYNKLHCDV